MAASSGYPALLHAIIDSTDDAVIGMNVDGIVTLWNCAAERIFGFSHAEMVGRSTAEIVPAYKRGEEDDVMARALGGELVDHFETIRVHKSGRPIEMSLTVSPIRDDSGKLVGVSHIARDVTERKALDRQAFHLAALVSSSDDAIASKDLTGTVLSWNQAAERMFGYTAADIVGQSIRLIIPADRWSEEDDVLRSVRAGGRIEHFETLRQRKDGVLIPVSVTVSPIRTDTGEIVGASKIVRDVSERSTMERETRRLAAIVDSSDDAIISKDLNGVVQTWNRAAEQMFGYTPAEMIGRPITTIIPEDRLQEEGDVLGRIRSGMSIGHYETIRRAKDGTLVPISLTVSPICDRHGRVVGASKIARDLSVLRAYATTLEQTVKARTASLELANTQLESFAYSVSHDLRAPLRGMQGLSHALLEDYGEQLDERGRDYAARIVREAAALDQLIQDLLTYSRLTHIEVEMEDIGVGEVLDSALENLREDIRLSHAVVRVSGSLPNVRANRTMLIQAVTNLISNAVKFGGAHPAVVVVLERDGDLARITVEDHGIGIAPQHQERIFRAFERLHGVERYPGTGMGLAIVRKAMERQGGRVGVQSEEGQGSRFWIELPRSMAAA
jgi:PAS domain S-box-containing protein